MESSAGRAGSSGFGGSLRQTDDSVVPRTSSADGWMAKAPASRRIILSVVVGI